MYLANSNLPSWQRNKVGKGEGVSGAQIEMVSGCEPRTGWTTHRGHKGHDVLRGPLRQAHAGVERDIVHQPGIHKAQGEVRDVRQKGAADDGAARLGRNRGARLGDDGVNLLINVNKAFYKWNFLK
jgi:hypothetical protein